MLVLLHFADHRQHTFTVARARQFSQVVQVNVRQGATDKVLSKRFFCVSTCGGISDLNLHEAKNAAVIVQPKPEFVTTIF